MVNFHVLLPKVLVGIRQLKEEHHIHIIKFSARENIKKGKENEFMAVGQITWENFITNNNDARGVRYKFEDFDIIRVILDDDKSAIYPDKFVSWPITEFEKVSETVNTKEPVESEPTDIEATEPVQEKGTGEDAPLPIAALVAIIGTAVIICLIIALCVILRRNGKENDKTE